jgi:hypothetical protein
MDTIQLSALLTGENLKRIVTDLNLAAKTIGTDKRRLISENKNAI